VPYVKEPSMLKATSAKDRFRFAALHRQWWYSNMIEIINKIKKKTNNRLLLVARVVFLWMCIAVVIVVWRIMNCLHILSFIVFPHFKHHFQLRLKKKIPCYTPPPIVKNWFMNFLQTFVFHLSCLMCIKLKFVTVQHSKCIKLQN
jgi:hypothetical protein